MITKCRVRFLDDGSEMDVRIYAYDCEPEDEGTAFDDSIFFYGMSRAQCIENMKKGIICENEWKIIEVYAEDESVYTKCNLAFRGLS